MKIIVNGAGGRMGKEVVNLAQAGFRGAELAAGVDINIQQKTEYPCYKNLKDVSETADCIVDFSNHQGTAMLLSYAVAKKIPVVVATTGHTDREILMIKEASKQIPVFRSANMSLGVALLVELAKVAAKTMPDADIEIIEKHHNRKVDVPSGTALNLAKLTGRSVLCGRSANGKRGKEVCVHSVRGGNIFGEHSVILAIDDEIIEIKHTAYSRRIFARGAVQAAHWLKGKPAGIYNPLDCISGLC